jgi:hypothetical protein
MSRRHVSTSGALVPDPSSDTLLAQMTRVLFLSPASTDADVRRHADTIAAIHGVTVAQQLAPEEDRLAYILRSAARLFRGRRGIDLVITVGASALAAANIGWRGPLIHIVVGRLTRTEASLCRGLAGRADFRIVTSSAAIAREAMRNLADVHKVRLIRPTAASTPATREEARARLGIGPDVPLVHVPGLPRPGSGHRLAMWAGSILIFRDPATRLLISSGGPGDGAVQRFARNALQSHALITRPHLAQSDLLAAADVAICTADRAPDFAALDALRQAGVPIVGLQSTWDRERLHGLPARLIDDTRARLIARTALEAFDGSPASARQPPGRSSTAAPASEWSHVLQSLVLPRRAAD